MSLVQQAEIINDRMIGQFFSIGSEAQRKAYLQTLRVNFDTFLSLVVQHLTRSAGAVQTCLPSPVCVLRTGRHRQAGLDLVLRRKAIGAEALAAQRDAVLSGRYPELELRLRELTGLRNQIAQKALSGPGPEDPDAHQRLLAEWRAHKEELEAELARQIPEMNLEQQLRVADRPAVAKALPEGTALVEFVRFDVYDFEAMPAKGDPQWQPAHYLAFTLPADEPDNVQMIDLGEAEPIDQMITAFRASVTGEAESRDARHLRPSPQATSTREGTALRATLFDPLLPALGDCKRLFLAPDGDLSRLPFEVLPLDDHRHLIDEYEISYLSTGRDALRFGAPSTGEPAPPLIAADPDFTLGANGKFTPADAEGTRGRQSRDLDRSTLYFRRLPGTRMEGEHIAGMLGVEPLLQEEVLESSLKASRSPRILHIATHGFFLPDLSAVPVCACLCVPARRQVPRTGRPAQAGQQRDPNRELVEPSIIGTTMGDRWSQLSTLENPLLRSGLALAGVNTWLKGGSLPKEAEDGLLTAEDVSGLDLLTTELVVLSACETGLGEVQVGEGVFGLRRAFVLAGAKTLVMSLWKVPDQQTQELMVDFYRRILAGQPRAEALREAQLAMKSKYPNPLYWGTFICQGDPGPLSGYMSRPI